MIPLSTKTIRSLLIAFFAFSGCFFVITESNASAGVMISLSWEGEQLVETSPTEQKPLVVEDREESSCTSVEGTSSVSPGFACLLETNIYLSLKPCGVCDLEPVENLGEEHTLDMLRPA